MLGIFGSIKDFVPVGKKSGSPRTEGVIAHLHYRVTTLILFGCCVLVTALDWIGTVNRFLIYYYNLFHFMYILKFCLKKVMKEKL